MIVCQSPFATSVRPRQWHERSSNRRSHLVTDTLPRASSPFCAEYSLEAGERPAGSAPSWKRCLVFELPRPWLPDVPDTPHFPEAVKDAASRAEEAGRDVRLQCVSPDREYSAEGHTTVMLFSRPARPFTAFEREEYLVPTEALGDLAAALLVDREDLGSFARWRRESNGVRDMLVCTHGSRDKCCASMGFPVYEELRQRQAPMLGGRMRVWQVSHLGGHRLAPNLIDMPSGRNWVRLGPEQVGPLVFHERPPSDLEANYRGLVGLDSPYEMVAEGEVLMREGWDIVGRPISVEAVPSSNGVEGAEVRVETSSPDGQPLVYAVKVELSGTVEYIKCVGREGEGVEEEAQYTVARVEKVR